MARARVNHRGAIVRNASRTTLRRVRRTKTRFAKHGPAWPRKARKCRRAASARIRAASARIRAGAAIRARSRTIRAALTAAGINAEDVDYVNAHGTATPQNDSAETAALKSGLKDRAQAAMAQLPDEASIFRAEMPRISCTSR